MRRAPRRRRGRLDIHYDYDVHLAIAKATRNDLIRGFLRYLQPLIVPRFRLGHVVSAETKDAYYARIHAEHEAIVEAIERRAAPASRIAMRTHLMNSLERVRALALAAGVDRADGLLAKAVADLLAVPPREPRTAKATQYRPETGADM